MHSTLSISFQQLTMSGSTKRKLSARRKSKALLNAMEINSLGTRLTSQPAKDNLRVVVLGAAGVGKTCIINQFLHEKFIEEYKETVEELYRKSLKYARVGFNLEILDTSGSYDFPAMKKLAIATGDAFVLVYALNDKESFKTVESYRQQIMEQKDNDSVPIVVVGNKADTISSERDYERELAESTVCCDWNHSYMAVSAKDNEDISGIFTELFNLLDVQFTVKEDRRSSLPLFRRMSMTVFENRKRHSCLLS